MLEESIELNNEMSELNILIIEDDLSQLEYLEKVLREIGFINLFLSSSYSDAAEKMASLDVDLVISDFYLDLGKTAVDLLIINLNNHNVPFLILSASYSNVVLEQVRNFTNIDFYPKNLSKFDLKKAVTLLTSKSNLIEKTESKLKDIFFVKQRHNLVKVKVSSIEFIEVDGKYLDIHTTDKEKYIIRSSLNDFLKKLPNSVVKIRQNIAVNIDYVKSLSIEDMTVLTENRTLNISRNYKSDFVSKFVLK